MSGLSREQQRLGHRIAVVGQFVGMILFTACASRSQTDPAAFGYWIALVGYCAFWAAFSIRWLSADRRQKAARSGKIAA